MQALLTFAQIRNKLRRCFNLVLQLNDFRPRFIQLFYRFLQIFFIRGKLILYFLCLLCKLIVFFDGFDLLFAVRVGAAEICGQRVSVVVAPHDIATELLNHLGRPHFLQIVEVVGICRRELISLAKRRKLVLLTCIGLSVCLLKLVDLLLGLAEDAWLGHQRLLLLRLGE